MKHGQHILVVDDEPDIRALVQEILEDENYVVSVARDAESAREARRARRPDLILLDIWMPDTDGITLLREWSESSGPAVPVVMMSGHGTVETAVEATRLGAYDFIEKPLSIAKLLIAVRRALEAARLEHENLGLRRETGAVTEPVGRSAVMEAVRARIARIAQHDAPVLITGESGSGKEVCARYLHQLGSHRQAAFVSVAVGSLAQDSAAAELFGTESGDQVHFGRLEQANGGTLFLGDIVDMPPSVQTRLLSALLQRSFLRVDGREPVEFDVRLIAATSQNPVEAVDRGSLREDLYYHLNVVPLEVPPLREHREDVPELLSYYIDRITTAESLPYRRFTVGAQNRLRNHDWPGNIRELKNLVHRLLILGSGADIAQEEIESAVGVRPRIRDPKELPGFDLPLKDAREDFERRYLEHQLRATGGSVSKAAERVGLERTHLYRKLRALGIDPKRLGPDGG